ncbi:MAG: MoxR family ATPase [Betaproteobacteria bacterium]|nr:MoxR family ATPase [Betaproteobacteria bacterium]
MTATPIDDLIARLATTGYIADKSLATVIYLALRMQRPLFLEGEAGVGKTEVAKVLARMDNRPLVRLQCYEGLDLNSAAYEWNAAKQMIAIRAKETSGNVNARDVYTRDFLIARPLLNAIELSIAGVPPVLLIDELDRADEPFEAFLLEVLSDFQITIPELGALAAPANARPTVIVTSNRTREIHDALKRRCLYHWVDYPDAEREWAIVSAQAPDLPAELSKQVVAFVQKLRNEDLFKPPGVAETLDWARALAALDAVELNPETVSATLGALLKYQEDIERVRGDRLNMLLANA